MNGLKLRHLSLVLAISRAQSLAQAAERLCITPAAVSKALGEVESLFGQALFERGRGWIRPTLLGQTVIASARQVQGEIAALAERTDGLRQGESGEIAIGVKAVSLHPFLAQVLATFSDQFPGVRVHVVEGSSASLRDMLIEGRLSLLFARLTSDMLRTGLASADVATDHVTVVASANHPLARRRKLSWRELVDYPWCLPAPGTLMRDHLEQVLAAEGLEMPARFVETSDMTLVALLFRLRPYLTLVPARVAHRFLGTPTGRILPITLPPVGDAVGMIWNARLPMLPSAQRFLETALAQLREPSPP